MRITNALNLPEPLVKAVEYDDHTPSGNNYSVTALISPPRLRYLRGMHEDGLSEDVTDRVWLLLGTAVHNILERAAKEDRLNDGMYEHALVAKSADDLSVGGTMDVYEDGVISDYKITSVWSVKDGCKPEWAQQLNIYGWLARKNGLKVTKLQVVAILRDWTNGFALKHPDMAKTPIAIVDAPLWEEAEAEAFVEGRVHAHESARENLPDCTDEERWMTPTVWAVHKKGRQKALKLHDSEASAEAHVKEIGDEYYVDKRPGQPRRCQEYCPVSQFCSQHKEWLMEEANNVD